MIMLQMSFVELTSTFLIEDKMLENEAAMIPSRTSSWDDTIQFVHLEYMRVCIHVLFFLIKIKGMLLSTWKQLLIVNESISAENKRQHKALSDKWPSRCWKFDFTTKKTYFRSTLTILCSSVKELYTITMWKRNLNTKCIKLFAVRKYLSKRLRVKKIEYGKCF